MIPICPCIKARDSELVASSSLLGIAITLGLSMRRVTVNRDSKTIVIEDRHAWLVTRSRTIPFQAIRAVTYGYEEAAPLGGWFARDPIDRFLVGLRPKLGDEIKLFSFLGDGTFTNDGPLPDWCYWDDFLFDYTGPQEQRSRLFVQLLSKTLGAPVEPSTLTSE